VVTKEIEANEDRRGTLNHVDAINRACMEACMAGMIYEAWFTRTGGSKNTAVPLAPLSLVINSLTENPMITMPYIYRTFGEWLQSPHIRDMITALETVRALAALLDELNGGDGGLEFMHGDMHVFNVLIDQTAGAVVYLADFAEASARLVVPDAGDAPDTTSDRRVGYGILDPRTYAHSRFGWTGDIFVPPGDVHEARVGYNASYDMMVLCCSIFWARTNMRLSVAPLMRYLFDQAYAGLEWSIEDGELDEITGERNLNPEFEAMEKIWRRRLGVAGDPVDTFLKRVNTDLVEYEKDELFSDSHDGTHEQYMLLQETAHIRCDGFRPDVIIRYTEAMIELFRREGEKPRTSEILDAVIGEPERALARGSA
jgi:hypothetical protein